MLWVMGHAQAHTAGLAGHGSILPLEGQEDPLQELRSHTDTVVADGEAVETLVRSAAGQLFRLQMDASAGGGVFDGVGQEVVQDLIEPVSVRQDLRGGRQGHVHRKFLVIGLGLHLEHGGSLFQVAAQIHRGQMQFHLSLFDLGGVQHLVDQMQQLGGGG